VQVVAAVLGVFAAHAMFAEPILQVSTKLRDGPAQDFSEFVATFGLVLDDPRDHARSACVHADGRGPLHHRGLLVHGVHILRQPGGYHRPQPQRHLRGHRTGKRAGLLAGQLAGALAATAISSWLLGRGPLRSV
jgi:hypothetical protein